MQPTEVTYSATEQPQRKGELYRDSDQLMGRLLSVDDGGNKNRVTLQELMFLYAHVATFYAIYICFTSAKGETIIFAFLLGCLATFGVKVSSRQSDGTNLAYKLGLLILNALACQQIAMDWLRDDGSPLKGTPDQLKSSTKQETVMSNARAPSKIALLLNLPKICAVSLIGLMCFVIPATLPMYCWNESFNNSWHVVVVLRYIFSWNSTFLLL